MRIGTLLPISWQLAIGRWIGTISYYIAPYRRTIATINIQLCFPELSKKQQKQLIKKSFASAGEGIMEIAMAWWLTDKRLENLTEWSGCEYFDSAIATGRPVIIAGAHFTCLEIAGRLFAQRYQYQLMHRPHKNLLFNAMMSKKRKASANYVINRDDMRGMIRAIKTKIPMWYAPDQDYGAKHSVFAPFFGIPAASIYILSRLAKHTNAIVIPLAYHRKSKDIGYKFRFGPIFTNYPSGNWTTDATQYNDFLTQDLRSDPTQYLWQHRRFKTRPPGETKLYPSKRHRRRRKRFIYLNYNRFKNYIRNCLHYKQK